MFCRSSLKLDVVCTSSISKLILTLNRSDKDLGYGLTLCNRCLGLPMINLLISEQKVLVWDKSRFFFV